MSGEVIRRHTYGEAKSVSAPIIGTASLCGKEGNHDRIRILSKEEALSIDDLKSFAAIVTDLAVSDKPSSDPEAAIPLLSGAEHLDHIHEGDILKIDFKKGFVRSLYRMNSPHNSIFATDQCNSNCLMCSQPPKDVDDGDVVDEHLRLISLIPPTTQTLGISGGEPTLLGDGLVRVIAACKEYLPVTRLHMLSNGRRFADRAYTAKLAQVRHPNFMIGVPLYSDVASHHDFVVQADGAFDQTMVGLHNLARYRMAIEVRIVVHKQTVERLPKLADYIYRNLPFVQHIAFMGLEMMGYTKTNLKTLWIDPVDYQDVLQEAVLRLARASMNVSIYNHQLCVLRRSLWQFARKSISDFKNIYIDQCHQCSVVDECGGLFKSAENIHSAHIRPIISDEV